MVSFTPNSTPASGSPLCFSSLRCCLRASFSRRFSLRTCSFKRFVKLVRLPAKSASKAIDARYYQNYALSFARNTFAAAAFLRRRSFCLRRRCCRDLSPFTKDMISPFGSHVSIRYADERSVNVEEQPVDFHPSCDVEVRINSPENGTARTRGAGRLSCWQLTGSRQ